MEEDDTRRFQRNKGRFGVRTNKTLKYNTDEAWSRRKEHDSIIVIDEDNQPYNGGRQALGISLNARKNWELFENNNRNSLKSSQDDMDVNYGTRIVVLPDVPHRKNPSHWQRYKHDVYGPNSDDEDQNEEESKVVSGTNRKGFFVKEKRKKGKKGVLMTQERKRSKSFNNRNSQSESDSDSAIDEESKNNERIIIASIKPKHPDYVTHADNAGCGCSLCTGIEKNHKINKRRDIVRDLDAL